MDITYSDNNLREDRIRFYQKKNKLREMVLKCDWKKDGAMVLGGRKVEYLSAGKVTRNFSPLLSKVGMEIECGFKQPVHMEPFGQKGEEHWVVEFYVSYIDIETGYQSQVNSYFGEAMDPRDKSLKKACTDAQKLWLLTDFKIEEGIDPESPEYDDRQFIPKSEDENTEIKTKIAALAVKPKTPAPKAEVKTEDPLFKKAPVAEEPKKEEPVQEEPKKAPAKKVPAKKEEPKVEGPAPAEDSGRVGPGINTEYGSKITEVQKKPLFALFGKWMSAHAEKKISDERYEQVKQVYCDIGSNKDVMKFLTEYREVKE